MADLIIVETKIDSRDGAHKIAQVLVERRLAAAAQVSGPITSTYWWKGQIEHAEEWACTAKTRQDLYDPLEQAIRDLHPYETPSIVATLIVAGSQSYLEWVEAETSAPVP
ncbi:MAG: divalent-cation tolerance protein CutA [Chloroflexota bacterium]|jgi:periplasmic divalent cation tolerance protein|nr:divalent-cation tolerance protein CutA [Chloroflexota bacterium]